jgi:PqqD family protein of HPr-rel-A system
MAVWRVAPAEMRVAVALDSLTALYDRRSGQTHVLASPLPEILTALDAGPADAEQLVVRLSKTFDLRTDNADARVVLQARLQELAGLGLLTAG